MKFTAYVRAHDIASGKYGKITSKSLDGFIGKKVTITVEELKG
jgi:hypothetical protein